MTTREELHTANPTIEKISAKVLLSTLWLFGMLTYTYGDVVTLMDPVKHGTFALTEGFLLGGSIIMMIPILMVLLSRLLPYRANRWANLVAGTFMTAFLTLTLFVAVPTTYYAFFSVIEIATTAVIVGYAWKWSTAEVNPVNLARAQGGAAA